MQARHMTAGELAVALRAGAWIETAITHETATAPSGALSSPTTNPEARRGAFLCPEKVYHTPGGLSSNNPI